MPAYSKTLRWEDNVRGSALSLVGFFPTGPARVWALEGTRSIGRMGSGADIEIPSGIVSACHGQVGVVGGKVLYRDLDSTNGTWLGGQRLSSTVELEPGDTLCFAPANNPAAVDFRLTLVSAQEEDYSWRKLPFGDEVQEVVFGRGSGDVELDDAFVSEYHASLFRSSKGLYAIDHFSTNGVFVNEKRVEGTAPVAAFDVVRIGQTLVYVLDDVLWVGEPSAPVVEPELVPTPEPAAVAEAAVTPEPAPKPTPAPQPTPTPAPQTTPTPAPEPMPTPQPAPAPKPAPSPEAAFVPKPLHQTALVPQRGGLVIDIEEKNVWSRFKQKTILRDVHLSVTPGEFVLILGGSGAGKTTFLKAVMGDDKAEGTIRLGDLDVYEEYELIKYQIGYVPQQDLLRHNDSVRETLFAAARLRMPSSSSREECWDRVTWSSELLGLGRELDTMVGRLSGGQRKRLSIAVELVGDPALFFLDEPDSGLDGIMSRALMENLRSIADLGKMVLVITHGPDRAADLFHKVIVLAKSERDGAGHLLFFGSVDEAKGFFGVDTLEGVVRRINRPDEGGEGLADYYLDKWEGR